MQTFVKESDLTSNDYQNQSGKGPECDDADTSSESLRGNNINLLRLSSQHTFTWIHAYFLYTGVYNITQHVIMSVLVFAEVLQKIKLPAKVRKRERLKGAEKIVIGLPRKKKRGNKPVLFLKKCPADKERGWFVFLTN